MIKKIYNFFSKPLYKKILDLIIPDMIIGDIIRLGRPNDGGYVVTKKNLTKYKYLLSFGISNDVSFEKDFNTNNPNCKIFCFDPTVESLPEKVSNAKFFKLGIDSISNENYKTLPDILKMLNISKDDLKYTFLKMDIEGYEWRVFSHQDSFNLIEQINQIAIEFHFKYLISGTKYRLPIELIKRSIIIKKIRKKHHIFNLHANNCEGYEGVTKYNNFQFPHVVEISLINRTSIKEIVLDLNQKCDPEMPDIQNFYL
jgi:hypothetical protein